MSPEIDETPRPGELPETLAERLALEKANAASLERPDSAVIGGDTVVVIDGTILGKPANPTEAKRMLSMLSGRRHQVITGVAIRHPEVSVLFSEVSQVTFRTLSEEEIASYVATGEPMDKAGAYAIQGGAAGFVTDVEGSWTNVVGLPIERLSQELKRLS